MHVAEYNVRERTCVALDYRRGTIETRSLSAVFTYTLNDTTLCMKLFVQPTPNTSILQWCPHLLSNETVIHLTHTHKMQALCIYVIYVFRALCLCPCMHITAYISHKHFSAKRNQTPRVCLTSRHTYTGVSSVCQLPVAQAWPTNKYCIINPVTYTNKSVDENASRKSREIDVAHCTCQMLCFVLEMPPPLER